jgi:hypothetical protein
VKRVACYLLQKQNFGLHFNKPDSTSTLPAFIDADWAADKTTSCIMTSYVIFSNKTLIAWHSTRQKCVALSTVEGEYIALTEVVAKVIAIHQTITFMASVCKSKIEPTTINCNNQGAISIASSGTPLARTRDIRVHFAYFKDQILKNEI